jgi:hypothetical protein
MSVSTMQASVHPEMEEELEGESEEFLGGLARRAAQAVLGSLGGQSDGEYEDESEWEAEDEDEGEEFVGGFGNIVQGLLGGQGESEYEDEGEYEWEGESEDESEAMANPLRRVYPDAMMEHLGHAAAEAETEAEAEAFVGALVPLAAGLARSAAPAMARATPQMVRGLSGVTRMLRRNPTTRQLVRVIPTIASRTARSLARQYGHGRPMTARRVIRTLAGQTAAVLSDPRRRHHAIRRARVLDRRYHRYRRGGQWWTQGAPGYRRRGYQGSSGYGGTTVVRSGAPGGYTTRGYGSVAAGPAAAGPAAAGSAVLAQRAPRPHVHGPGPRRRRRYPPGLTVAWVPVPAWRGSSPPRAYRY